MKMQQKTYTITGLTPVLGAQAANPNVHSEYIAASETIDTDWALTFTVHLLDNPASPKSRALTFDVIEEALEYGAFKGIGQWRNAQYGQFAWREED